MFVRPVGLEPTPPKQGPAPQAGASTNSATSALSSFYTGSPFLIGNDNNPIL